MAIVFNGVELHIELDTITTFYTVQEIYSRWKDWVLENNAGYPPAFRVVGGDPISDTTASPAFFFLRNDLGWRVQKPNSTIEVTIDGNLVGESTTDSLFADPDMPSFFPTIIVNRTEVTSVDLTQVWTSIIADFQDPGTAGQIIQRILDIMQADEILTPTTATKYIKGTAPAATGIIVQKTVSGGNITDTISLLE